VPQYRVYVQVPALDEAPFPLATPTYTRILMVSEISTCRLLVPKSCSGHVVTPEQTLEHKVHCITQSTTALSVSTGKKEYHGRSRGEDQGQVEWKRRADVRPGSDVPLGLCTLVLAKTSSHHDIWGGWKHYIIKCLCLKNISKTPLHTIKSNVIKK